MTLPLTQIPVPVATDAVEDSTNPPMRNFGMKKLIKKNDGSFEFEKKNDFICYTPGPWRMAPGISHPWIIECETNIEGVYNTVASVGYKPNATLIAAATDLLKACQLLVRELKEFYTPDQSEALRVAAIAISKATKVES